jgi:hypothetical protein
MTGPASEEEKLSSEKKLKGIKALFRFQETERGYISKSIPGAIIENLNKTHQCLFWLGDKYFSLKTMTGIIH